MIWFEISDIIHWKLRVYRDPHSQFIDTHDHRRAFLLRFAHNFTNSTRHDTQLRYIDTFVCDINNNGNTIVTSLVYIRTFFCAFAWKLSIVNYPRAQPAPKRLPQPQHYQTIAVRWRLLHNKSHKTNTFFYEYNIKICRFL